GTITWGADIREAYEGTIALITAAEEAIGERRRGRRVFGAVRVAPLSAPERRQVAAAVVPGLRGLLSRRRRAVVSFDASKPDPARGPRARTRDVHGGARPAHGRHHRRHLPPHDRGPRERVGLRSLRVAVRAGRVRRRVLAARAVQAHARTTGEGIGSSRGRG